MKALFALISILGVTLLGTASFAATCNEPVPAPTYQAGDKFTWKYTYGSGDLLPPSEERVWEVTRASSKSSKSR